MPEFYFVAAEVGEDPDKRNYIVSNARIEATGFRRPSVPGRRDPGADQGIPGDPPEPVRERVAGPMFWQVNHRASGILPTSGWQTVNVRELWRFRELLYFLVWRDVKVRYKQTAARGRLGGPAAAS